jgi:tellurite methyltransferase
MTGNRSIAFFDEQFRGEPTAAALKLNPFEQLALPYLRGEVLDFGCGLGNLAFAAAQRGCTVTALDASPAAVAHILARAAAEGAPVSASMADLRDYPITGEYDCIVSIGLLMFFDCPRAFKVLSRLQSHVRPGGVAVVNVLVEGTTYLDMFDPSGHCLFAASELERRFAGWHIEHCEFSEFEAPHRTLKRFSTVIARKPDASQPARPQRCP